MLIIKKKKKNSLKKKKVKDMTVLRRVCSRVSSSAEMSPQVTGNLDSEDEWDLGVVLK